MGSLPHQKEETQQNSLEAALAEDSDLELDADDAQVSQNGAATVQSPPHASVKTNSSTHCSGDPDYEVPSGGQST